MNTLASWNDSLAFLITTTYKSYQMKGPLDAAGSYLGSVIALRIKRGINFTFASCSA